MALYLIAAVGLLPQVQTPLRPADLDRVRDAMQYSKLANHRGDLVATGTANRMNVEGPYRLRFSPTGAYSYEIRSGLGQKAGFDGQLAWEADWTGATRVLSFGEADRARSMSLWLTQSWLDPKAPLEMSWGSEPHTLNVKLKGSLLPHVLTIDPQTSLPTQVTFQSSAGKVVLKFDDWQNTSVGKLPFTTTLTEGGVTDMRKVKAITPIGKGTAKDFAVPAWKPSDVRFDASIAPQVESKRLRSGHIVVHPKLNGKDVGWFILDSGAETMCIDKTTADELGLMTLGKVPAVGVGGVVEASFRTVRDFALGPATIRNLAFVELDLAQISRLLNLKLGGIIGYDVFRRAVVEMDVQTPTVALHDPAVYRREDARWSPIRFDGGTIGVEAKFEGGRSGWFRFDTGASGSVSFHGPFVQKYKLLEGRELTKSQEGGVGGMVESRRGQIEYFELAGYRFEKPTVGFSMAQVGALTDPWLVGNIGQEFMNPFVLVFDYPRSRMAFIPRKAANDRHSSQ